MVQHIRSLLVLSGVLFFLSGCETGQVGSEGAKLENPPPEAVDVQPKGQPFAVVETDKGAFVIQLQPEIAPETVKNFIDLADAGFYSRTTFHRVMKGRMIQGGDPFSRDKDPFNDGQGNSGRELPQEFGDTPVDRGVVAMARGAGTSDGGSCQFFVVLMRSPEWDGKYNVFGKVVEGIEVVDEISSAPLSKSTHPNLKYRPAGKQIIKSIRIEYREAG